MSLDKVIDIQFISKLQFISVMSVDLVSPLNCECVLSERLSLLGIFVSWNTGCPVEIWLPTLQPTSIGSAGHSLLRFLVQCVP
jgi:hypothetical protein